MNQYHPPERISRMELRRTHHDRGVRRSVSLDAQGHSFQGCHYDNHSLRGESSDNNDDDDQRCQSPLPCNEGCRDLLTKLMSPMISSIAIDQSISLGREDFRSIDTPCKEPEEEPKLIEQNFQHDTKQHAYAARKSVRELYGRPSWWGDNDNEGGDDDQTERKKPLSRTSSVEPFQKIYPSDQAPMSPPGQVAPVRQAEAFTIDLTAEGGGDSASRGVCVPERLRKALQERQKLQRKRFTPTERPTTAPVAKKTPTRRIGDPLLSAKAPTKSGQTLVTKTPVRSKVGLSQSPIASPFTSPKNAPRHTPATLSVVPKAEKAPGITVTAQKKERANLKNPRAPNPLTQRNRIPLRQAPSKAPVTTNRLRKPLTNRVEVSRASPSPSSSPFAVKTYNPSNISGTPVGATVQSNRDPLKSSLGPIFGESGVQRPVGSPLTRRITPSVWTASGVVRQTTPTRTAISENKRVSSAAQNTTRLMEAPAFLNARGALTTARPKSTRPLFNSIKKPITTTTSPNALTGSTIALPTKPIFNGSAICDPLVQEIWSYKEAKDYVMEKMFQGIATTYNAVTASKSTTQSVFEEFKAAAAQSAATTSALKVMAGITAVTKPKLPIVCTPEEGKELELFERVEAEIDKFGEEEEALAQALSPLVEDFTKTWIRRKNVNKSVEDSHTPMESLSVVDNPTDVNLATQVMSTAASTVTLENPLTRPEDYNADPDSLQNAQSVQSIAETYVLDVNDTLAAEGIPPVVIFDSSTKPSMEARSEANIMETSNTCTIPYQGATTSRSGTPILGIEPEEAEALEIFEKEINEEFKAEADSLSGSEDLESKSNGGRGGLLLVNSRCQGPSSVPEYLIKAPCWSEKREGSKKSPLTPNSDATKKIENQFASKHVSPLESPPLHSTDPCVATHEDHSIIFTPISQTGAIPITSTFNISSNPAPIPRGQSFTANDPSDFPNASASTSTSSSSSSPLIDHFKDEFLQPEVSPLSAVVRPTTHVVSSIYDKKAVTEHQRTQSASTYRSWNAENDSVDETWGQLRRHASRCSVQSEYGEGGRSPKIGYDPGHHHRQSYLSMRYCSSGVKKNSDAVYPIAVGQQTPLIRSTHSTASLDTALLLRDSQEALNEMDRRIYGQQTHPTVPATPIQLPQLQNLSSYLSHRCTESNVDKNSANEKYPPLSSLSQLVVGDLGTQSIDRSLMGSRSTNRTSSYFFAPAQPQGYNDVRPSLANMPYSPPVSAPPLSPLSISSATEPGHPFRNGRRATNSKYVVRRHSLRSSNHQRADSPTPNDIFPSEHPNTTAAHAPTCHMTTKVISEVKVMPSRPTGLSVTTTVPPLVLQRRSEAETKLYPAVAITPIVRGSQPASTVTDASIGGSSSSKKTPLTEDTHTGSIGGIAKPMARRFDAPLDDFLRGSAFSTVAASRAVLRPMELRSADPSERCRRSMSLGPVETISADDDEILPPCSPSDKVNHCELSAVRMIRPSERPHWPATEKQPVLLFLRRIFGSHLFSHRKLTLTPQHRQENYETLLATSILHLSNRLRRCSDNLAQRIGAPSSDANSPVGPSYWKGSLKPSTSLHQELNVSLSNMRTVEQQLQYLESVLFGGHDSAINPSSACARGKSSMESDYLHELERINSELRGFVPIGAGGGDPIGERDTTTEMSRVSTEATDSGVDASIAAGHGSDAKNNIPAETASGCAVRRSDEDRTFSSGDFY